MFSASGKIIKILAVVGAALVLAAVFLLFFGRKEIKLEEKILINNEQAIPLNISPPPVILMAGETTATVKETKMAEREIVAEVNLPHFGRKSSGQFQFERRVFTLKIAEDAPFQSIAGDSTENELKWAAAALIDVKTGDKISFEYKGDILNPQTRTLSVASVKIYRMIKK